MTMTKGRFAVDLQGFRTQCLEIGVPRLVGELIANSFDNIECKNCWVEISKHGDIVHVKVRDDGSGFKKKEEINTLFMDSEKRDDPTLRGRFNYAEKQFLATCEDAEVKSNKWRIVLSKGDKKPKETNLSKKFEGTEIIGRIRQKDTNMEEILEYLKKIVLHALLFYYR